MAMGDLSWQEEGRIRQESSQRLLCAIDLVRHEVIKAQEKHNAINSLHEASAVIREEFEEFWEEVKSQKPNNASVEKELVQVAAMAIRAIVDLGPTYKSKSHGK